MGRQVVQVSMLVTGVSIFLSFVGIALPFHIKCFYEWPAGIMEAARMTTYSTRLVVHASNNPVCRVLAPALNWVSGSKDSCNSAAESVELVEVAQRACSPIVTSMIPNMCDGMTRANFLGVTMIIIVVFNAILQVISCYLHYNYLRVAPKKRYREVAQILQVIGLLLLLISVILYYPLVIMVLDDMAPGIISLVAPSQAGGTSWGYILTCVAVIVEVIAIVLASMAKSGAEDRFEEAREHRKFVAEVEMFEQASGAGRGVQNNAHPQQQPMPQMQQQYFQSSPAPQFGYAFNPGQPPPNWGSATAAGPPPMDPAQHHPAGGPYW